MKVNYQTTEFNETYNSLNDKQKLAVDQTEGPVMVIAGPGTGKTQLLSARIVNILIKTDACPENILCLTYTDTGMTAMLKRLQTLIGPDAHKVNIYTFHAFCNEIIQANLYLFEKTTLDAISDLERIEFFKELIDSFPMHHPLKRYRGDVYFEINNLQQLFSSMKREGWTPAFINEKIDEYIASLPSRDEFIYKKIYKNFQPGDLKKDKIEEVKEKMERLRAAANEFDHFQNIMQKNNRYDFDDMINWVIKAFQENKNLLANYQEKFQYILVDEYQDTSGTQNQLVQLLISHSYMPNIFIVGDDDQSIYRFQGANAENMLDFANSNKDLLTVVLTNNYRSTQPILDISKMLINQNKDRLVNIMEGLSKELISSNTLISQLKHPPVIHKYKTQEEEMIGITLAVEKLLAQQVAPGEIGIIYKENKYGEELACYFTLRGIPYFSKRNQNILEIPLAKKIILLLKYIAAEHDVPYSGDEMLFEILHFDWFHIPPFQIAQVSVEAASKKQENTNTSIRQLLHERAIITPKDPGIHEGLRKASLVLEQLITDAPNLTLQHLFENIIRQTSALSYIMQSPDKIWLLQVLKGLFNFIKDETSRKPFINLQQLVTILELMEKEELKLPLVQISGSEQGVNLLTAHGSKGLEFEHVFLAGTNANFWEKKRKPNSGFTFPDTMFSSTPKTEDDEELRRLFYVALTRAKQHLTISFSRYKNDGKEIESSMFIAEIQQEAALPIDEISIDEETEATFSALQFEKSKAPEIEKLEADFIDRRLEKFSLSVSSLNSYLKCPLDFYFNTILRVPSPKNENTAFGSAVHSALEQLFRKMQSSGQFPSKQEFIADFEHTMRRLRGDFTREQFDRRMEYGPEILSNYYDKYISSFNKNVVVEHTIRAIIEGIPMKGVLDKPELEKAVEFKGYNVNIVDYKTGDPEKAQNKLQPPSEKDPNGGDYWRQAIFYKILIDNSDQKNWKAVSTEFDFIEPDKKKNYHKKKVVINQESVDIVTKQINTVWNKIQNRDFYTGCGEPECHWCNFVKDNNLAVSPHESNK